MIFEWSTYSYLSWNYTGNSPIIIPLTKFEIDIRRKYLFHFHTSTYKYSFIYNNNKNHQLIIRRESILDDNNNNNDDYYKLKINSYNNQTYLIHLQIINNHYEIIFERNINKYFWNIYGYFHKDKFNGSLIILNNDWLLSLKLNFNSSLYISTGKYVQLISTNDDQISLEILLISHFHFVLQYTGLQSLICLKFLHNSSNIKFFFY